jgi:hypothetical protein
VLVCLNLLIESFLDETLLGQLLISCMIQYISHLVVIIGKSLLFTNQGLEMMGAVLQSSDSGQLTILMMGFDLSLGVFLTQLSVFHVHYSLEIFWVVFVRITKG